MTATMTTPNTSTLTLRVVATKMQNVITDCLAVALRGTGLSFADTLAAIAKVRMCDVFGQGAEDEAYATTELVASAIGCVKNDPAYMWGNGMCTEYQMLLVAEEVAHYAGRAAFTMLMLHRSWRVSDFDRCVSDISDYCDMATEVFLRTYPE